MRSLLLGAHLNTSDAQYDESCALTLHEPFSKWIVALLWKVVYLFGVHLFGAFARSLLERWIEYSRRRTAMQRQMQAHQSFLRWINWRKVLRDCNFVFKPADKAFFPETIQTPEKRSRQAAVYSYTLTRADVEVTNRAREAYTPGDGQAKLSPLTSIETSEVAGLLERRGFRRPTIALVDPKFAGFKGKAVALKNQAVDKAREGLRLVKDKDKQHRASNPSVTVTGGQEVDSTSTTTAAAVEWSSSVLVSPRLLPPPSAAITPVATSAKLERDPEAGHPEAGHSKAGIEAGDGQKASASLGGIGSEPTLLAAGPPLPASLPRPETPPLPSPPPSPGMVTGSRPFRKLPSDPEMLLKVQTAAVKVLQTWYRKDKTRRKRAARPLSRQTRIQTPPMMAAREALRFVHLLLQRSLATFGSAKEDRRWPIVFACCTAYGFSFSAILTITNWLDRGSVSHMAMQSLANYYAPGTANVQSSLLALADKHKIVTFGFENLITIGVFSAFCAVAFGVGNISGQSRWWVPLSTGLAAGLWLGLSPTRILSDFSSSSFNAISFFFLPRPGPNATATNATAAAGIASATELGSGDFGSGDSSASYASAPLLPAASPPSSPPVLEFFYTVVPGLGNFTLDPSGGVGSCVEMVPGSLIEQPNAAVALLGGQWRTSGNPFLSEVLASPGRQTRIALQQAGGIGLQQESGKTLFALAMHFLFWVGCLSFFFGLALQNGFLTLSFHPRYKWLLEARVHRTSFANFEQSGGGGGGGGGGGATTAAAATRRGEPTRKILREKAQTVRSIGATLFYKGVDGLLRGLRALTSDGHSQGSRPLPSQLAAIRITLYLVSLLLILLSVAAALVAVPELEALLSNLRIEVIKMRAQNEPVLQSIAPRLIYYIENLVLPLLSGPLTNLVWMKITLPLGAGFAALRLIAGQRDLFVCYPKIYDRILHEGPGCCAFPLRRVDAAKLVALFVAWTLTGAILYVITFTIVGFGIAATLTDGLLAKPMRLLVDSFVMAFLIDHLILMAFLMPMFSLLHLGFAQFAVQLYYLQIGLIKGLSRLGTCEPHLGVRRRRCRHSSAAKLVVANSFSPFLTPTSPPSSVRRHGALRGQLLLPSQVRFRLRTRSARRLAQGLYGARRVAGRPRQAHAPRQRQHPQGLFWRVERQEKGGAELGRGGLVRGAVDRHNQGLGVLGMMIPSRRKDSA